MQPEDAEWRKETSQIRLVLNWSSRFFSIRSPMTDPIPDRCPYQSGADVYDSFSVSQKQSLDF